MYARATGLHPAVARTFLRYEAAFARLGARLSTPSGDGFVRALHVGGRTLAYTKEAHILNSAAAAAIATDKLATYQVLEGSGVAVPPGMAFFAEETRGVASRVPHASLVNLAEVLPTVVASERVVVKPGMESQGRGVYICVGMKEVQHAAQNVLGYGHYGLAQAWIDGPEYRVALLGDEVLVCYEKRPPRLGGAGTIRARIAMYNASNPKGALDAAPRFVHGAWGLDDTPPEGADLELLGAANLSRGASAALISPPPELVDVALRAQSLVGLRHSAIDLRWPDRSKPPIVLEVNFNPGFEVLGATHPAIVDAITGRIAEAIVGEMAR